MSEKIRFVRCCDCGFVFHFSDEIAKIWAAKQKRFHCPNGHIIFFSNPPINEDLKKIEELSFQVASLKQKLEETERLLEETKLELEIWKPASQES